MKLVRHSWHIMINLVVCVLVAIDETVLTAHCQVWREKSKANINEEIIDYKMTALLDVSRQIEALK